MPFNPTSFASSISTDFAKRSATRIAKGGSPADAPATKHADRVILAAYSDKRNALALKIQKRMDGAVTADALLQDAQDLGIPVGGMNLLASETASTTESTTNTPQ